MNGALVIVGNRLHNPKKECDNHHEDDDDKEHRKQFPNKPKASGDTKIGTDKSKH
jgi:hypothetical protein